MKATGERVFTSAGGFNPTYRRHAAQYHAADALLPPDSPVLDLGCGIGHSFRVLAPRETVGVDLSAEALAGQDRETHVADMRALPFPDGRFASVVSVQSIEHVPDPERVLAEVVRVLRPGGVALFVTVNRLTFARPDEIIDPFHYHEYDAEQLRELCAPFFASVRPLGLAGSERYLEIVAREHVQLDRVLARDPLRVRRFVPRRVRMALYDAMLFRARRDPDPAAADIVEADFWVTEERLEAALDVMALCTRRTDGPGTPAPGL